MDNLLVSIIIPIYNVEKYIERCCHSLFGQSYSNIEYIFINDCTQDNSIEILNKTLYKYPDRIDNVKIINLPSNKGLAHTRNVGVEHANGEYITFVDSDDEVPHNAIEQYVIIIRECIVKPSIIMGRHSNNYIKNSSLDISFIELDKNILIYNILTKREKSNIWGNIYAHKLFENLKWWDGLNFGEDYATLPRLVSISNSIVGIPKFVYTYHTDNPGSYMRSVSKKSAEQLFSIIIKLEEYFTNIYSISNIDNIIIEAKLRCKSHLLQNCYKNNETFKYVANWFVEINLNFININLKEKLILYLSKYKCLNTLKAIIKLRLKFKNLFNVNN